jgi:hypothetical protein
MSAGRGEHWSGWIGRLKVVFGVPLKILTRNEIRIFEKS